MLLQLVALAGAVVLVIALIAIVFLLGMRAKSPWVLNPVIWLSRAVFNPMQMRTAGTPGAYASVIRHRGRISRRDYATPVGAVADKDGFLIALPYGSRANWLRNVLAEGSATLVAEGHTYLVDEPRIVSIEAVAKRFSPGDQRSHRIFNVEECLRLRRVEPIASATHVSESARPALATGSTGEPA